MARLPRLCAPGLPHSVLQQAVDGQPWVGDDADRQQVLQLLHQASTTHGVSVHAYHVLDDQLQLLATPRDDRGLSLMMQALGRGYVAGFNRRHQRQGPLWAGRFRATVLDPTQLLSAMIAVETEPQRRGLVARAADYRWSSVRHHLGQEVDGLIADAQAFWALGNTPFERQARYQHLVEAGVDPGVAETLRRHTQLGWAWGSAVFVAQLQAVGARRTSPKSRGRPRKAGPLPSAV